MAETKAAPAKAADTTKKAADTTKTAAADARKKVASSAKRAVGSAKKDDGPKATSGVSNAGGAAAPARRRGSAGGLQPSSGSTTIAESVVAKVVGLAAREVPGVYDLGGGAARAVGTVAQMVGMGDHKSQGVSVEVGEIEAAADLTVVIEYGESVPAVCEQIRERVIQRVEGITGLKVTEVNIEVDDLHFPGDDDDDDEQDEKDQGSRARGGKDADEPRGGKRGESKSQGRGERGRDKEEARDEDEDDDESGDEEEEKDERKSRVR